MFFTRVGSVLAKLVFGLGVFAVILAIGLMLIGEDVLTRRYLGSKTIGQSLDQGMYMMLVGIALGILSEISKNVAARLSSPKN